MKIDFEQFLMEKHAEDYIGTKDTMVDDFADWVTELGCDDFIAYGNMYAKSIKVNAELLEACKMALDTIIDLGNGYPYKGADIQIIRQAIKKAEEAK